MELGKLAMDELVGYPPVGLSYCLTKLDFHLLGHRWRYPLKFPPQLEL